MASVFISYRREDSQGWAGRLAAEVEQAFGAAPLFFDLETIAPGEDFVVAIERSLAKCRVLLALIGPRWLIVTLPDGQRRLDDPRDFVRAEIATALRLGISVIPVLLGGAKPPAASDLPDDLKALARRNAFELSDSRWRLDCDRLLHQIGEQAELARMQTPGQSAGVSVLGGATLEDVEAGNVTGIEGQAPSPGPVEVAKGAKITRTKLGDITGVKITGEGKKP